MSGHTVHLATSKHTHVTMPTHRGCPTSVLRSIVPLAELHRPHFRPMFNEVDVVVRVTNVQELADKMTVDVTEDVTVDVTVDDCG